MNGFSRGGRNLLCAALIAGIFGPELLAQTVHLQSKNILGTGAGNGNSQEPVISSDGEWVAFHSIANDLVANDSNNSLDVFLRNTSTGALIRISESSFGVQADRNSYNVEIARSSSTRQWLAYESDATNLVFQDTNQHTDIFLTRYDAGSGFPILTQRCSVSSLGNEGNGHSTNADVSADGAWVVFESGANNLVTGDTNGYRDIFVHDPLTGTTRRINFDSSGSQLIGQSIEPTISDDGRFVAYRTTAAGVVPNWPGNGTRQVYVIDRDANGNGIWDEMTDLTQTQMITVGTQPGTGVNNQTQNARISGDGRFVCFESYGTNLVANDTNNRYDIFVRDRIAGVTTRVSVDDFGAQSDGHCYRPRMSSDGRFVVFESDATNLDVTRIDPFLFDVFVHDRVTATTRRVSETGFYGTAVNHGVEADITDDGRFVAFRGDTAYEPLDQNFRRDVYLKDRIELRVTGSRQTGQPFGFEVRHAHGETNNGFLVIVGCSGVTPGIPVPNSSLIVPIQLDFCTNIALAQSFLFTGTIQAGGTGTTPQFPFPSIPPVALWAAALTWDTGTGLFESVTEPTSF